MRTTMKRGAGHHEHIITRKNEDGSQTTLTIWFVGRCWTYTTSTPGRMDFNWDCPGRESDHDLVKRLRRAFACGEIN